MSVTVADPRPILFEPGPAGIQKVPLQALPAPGGATMSMVFC
ncbi:hypothetical protein [Pseudoduganella dura]|nr:hypothetical protein [Pseudoduganella dura]